MITDADRILEALNLISSACQNIQDKGQCDNCPMQYVCMNGTYYGSEGMSFIDYADLIPRSRWDEFLDYADECIPSDSVADEMERELKGLILALVIAKKGLLWLSLLILSGWT